jgi:hypothetical protein
MKMKFRNCLVILLALLILITVFPAAYATPKINEAESSPLSVQINTNKNSYGTLGTAQVDVVVTNVSSETVYDVNVQNILPAQLMAFGMEDLTSCVDKLEPGKNISISFESCLNPNSAAVNAFITEGLFQNPERQQHRVCIRTGGNQRGTV